MNLEIITYNINNQESCLRLLLNEFSGKGGIVIAIQEYPETVSHQTATDLKNNFQVPNSRSKVKFLISKNLIIKKVKKRNTKFSDRYEGIDIRHKDKKFIRCIGVHGLDLLTRYPCASVMLHT